MATSEEILGIVAKPIIDTPPIENPVIPANVEIPATPAIPITETGEIPAQPTIPVQQIDPANLIGDLGIPVIEAPKTEQTKRGPGRPRGTRNRSGGSEIGDINAEDVPQVDYALMSSMCFDMGTNALSMVFGPEWQPNSEQEKNAVVASLASYMRAKEVKDIPPGMMLCFILAVYSAPRLRHQTTGGKLKLWFMWVRSKLTRKKNPAPTIFNP